MSSTPRRVAAWSARPHSESEEFVRSEYAGRADKWLGKLSSWIDSLRVNADLVGPPHHQPDSVPLKVGQLEDLHEVFGRAVTICKAAAGDRPSLQHLLFNKVDGLQMGMNHWATMLIAESLCDTIRKHGGENYVELELNGHEEGPILVRLQFKNKKTPAMVASERKEYILDLEDHLREKNEEIDDLKLEVEALIKENKELREAGGFDDDDQLHRLVERP